MTRYWRDRAQKAEARVAELEAALERGLAKFAEIRHARDAVLRTMALVSCEMAEAQRRRFRVIGRETK